MAASEPRYLAFNTARVAARLRAALPAVLFGLRTTVSVSVALAIAFKLELDQAYWAGTTAAIICQPILGSSLRKALFRMAGTLAGAVAAVLLFACFPQDRVGFTLAFAGWCALCGFIGSRLAFFAAYGAMLAGYTTAIIVGDVVSTPDQVFEVALARVTEIELGIIVASIVMATTQFGDRRNRLAESLQALAEQAVTVLLLVLRPGGPCLRDDEARIYLVRLAGLAQTIDQAVGEAVYWRLPLGPVRAAQNGLFASFAEARSLQLDPDFRPTDVHSTNVRSTPGSAATSLWEVLPTGLRNQSPGAAKSDLLAQTRIAERALSIVAAHDPETGWFAARAARALHAAVAALEVSAWLADPAWSQPTAAPACKAPADPLPALVNAARVFISALAAVSLWITTRWPNGPGAIVWVIIPVLLMSPQQEKAYDSALRFAVGTLLAAGLAAIVDFAVLPQLTTFGGLAGTLAIVLVPLAALSTVPRLTALMLPATFNFVPLVAPANQMSYDPQTFYNSALSIMVGCTLAAVALRTVPPLPVQTRVRRIIGAAKADCAAIRTGAWRPTPAQWCDRMRTRATALPETSMPGAFSEVAALFTAGDEALRSRGVARSPALQSGKRAWS